MSSQVPGRSLRQLLLGTLVAGTAKVLPATTKQSLFTVAGGRVLVTSLIGVCTTVCTSTATTVSLGTTPTVGTASATGIATATAVTSSEVGTLVSLPAGAKGALLVGANAGTAVQGYGDGYVVSAGTIDITTSATNTGAFQWQLTYIPLDDGASVTAL